MLGTVTPEAEPVSSAVACVTSLGSNSHHAWVGAMRTGPFQFCFRGKKRQGQIHFHLWPECDCPKNGGLPLLWLCSLSLAAPKMGSGNRCRSRVWASIDDSALSGRALDPDIAATGLTDGAPASEPEFLFFPHPVCCWGEAGRRLQQVKPGGHGRL